MIYILYTVISSLFLGLYDFFKKVSSKKSNNLYEILFFYCSVAFLCSFVFFRDAINTDFKYVGFIALKAIVISVSWFLTMKAVKKLDLSIVTPFSLLNTIFTTILAYFVFKQSIGLVQVLGCLVIFGGLILLSRLNDDKKQSDKKYVWLLVFASFLSSVSAIIDKTVLSDNVKYGSVLFWFFLFLSIIYLIINFNQNKKIAFSSLKNNLWVICIGVSIFFADLFYYIAVQDVSVSLSIISIIRKLSVFIGVLLASIFLKEEHLFKKLLILILMFVGLGLILFL